MRLLKGLISVIIIFVQFNLRAQNNYNAAKAHNCQELNSIAYEVKGMASSYLSGNKYDGWHNQKKFHYSLKEYQKALRIFKQLESMGCDYNDQYIIEIIYCLNQLERFSEARKIIQRLIDKKRFSQDFFNIYFMTRNKTSSIKYIKEHGGLLMLCGGGPDSFDTEYYYSQIMLENAVQLYNDKEYALLLHYLSHSKVRINWSEDTRLNSINQVLSQLILQSLLQLHSAKEIIAEFNDALLVRKEHDYFGIGDSMNWPQKELTLFEFTFYLYNDNISDVAKYNLKHNPGIGNQKAIIDFTAGNEVIKKSTILYEGIVGIE